eukprot:350462-Amphidinium_carterae.2
MFGRFTWFKRVFQTLAAESFHDARKAAAIISICGCDLSLLIIRRFPYRPGRRVLHKFIMKVRNIIHESDEERAVDDNPEVIGATVGYRPLCDIQAARWGGNPVSSISLI